PHIEFHMVLTNQYRSVLRIFFVTKLNISMVASQLRGLSERMRVPQQNGNKTLLQQRKYQNREKVDFKNSI
ncbi:MAG: hypothetical protein PHT76_14315, partial [Anaerostipes sp.]|nr:hypothetical protein [Anaerostipes sp.]